MSSYVQQDTELVPYLKYFEFFPCEKWSLSRYVTMIIENYERAEVRTAHRTFYNVLNSIVNDPYISQEVRNMSQHLISSRSVSILSQNKIRIGGVFNQVLVPVTFALIGLGINYLTSAKLDAFITFALINIWNLSL